MIGRKKNSAAVAPMAEQRTCNAMVGGSSPSGGSLIKLIL